MDKRKERLTVLKGKKALAKFTFTSKRELLLELIKEEIRDLKNEKKFITAFGSESSNLRNIKKDILEFKQILEIIMSQNNLEFINNLETKKLDYILGAIEVKLDELKELQEEGKQLEHKLLNGIMELYDLVYPLYVSKR